MIYGMIYYTHTLRITTNCLSHYSERLSTNVLIILVIPTYVLCLMVPVFYNILLDIYKTEQWHMSGLEYTPPFPPADVLIID